MANRSLKIDTQPFPREPVRVVLSADVASHLPSFQKAQAAILKRLGCAACCSGWDIRFDIARSFVVDDKFKVRELAGGIDVGNG